MLFKKDYLNQMKRYYHTKQKFKNIKDRDKNGEQNTTIK